MANMYDQWGGWGENSEAESKFGGNQTKTPRKKKQSKTPKSDNRKKSKVSKRSPKKSPAARTKKVAKGRCNGITLAGKPCKKMASKGRRFCYQHKAKK